MQLVPYESFDRFADRGAFPAQTNEPPTRWEKVLAARVLLRPLDRFHEEVLDGTAERLLTALDSSC